MSRTASGTQIEGNTIGLAEDGQTPLGNGGDGIELDDAPESVIGGLGTGEGNLISSNQGDGINTSRGSDGTWVAGNWIGTDTSGNLALGNLGNGITLGPRRTRSEGPLAGRRTSSNIMGPAAWGPGSSSWERLTRI